MRHCIRAAPAICGKVIKVSDEDTITVLTDDKESVRVRLWGIDAPEKNQAYGEASRKNLANLIAEKTFALSLTGTTNTAACSPKFFSEKKTNVCARFATATHGTTFFMPAKPKNLPTPKRMRERAGSGFGKIRNRFRPGISGATTESDKRLRPALSRGRICVAAQ